MQALGKTDFDFYKEEHARATSADEQAIIRTGQPAVGKEEKEVWRDGRVRWVSTTKMPFRDQDGKIVGTFGVSRDITKLKLAEEALRENEERFRSTFENAAVGIAHVDGQHRCLRANGVFCDIVGYSRAEVVGKTIPEVVYPDEGESNLTQFDRLLRGELASFTMENASSARTGRSSGPI